MQVGKSERDLWKLFAIDFSPVSTGTIIPVTNFDSSEAGSKRCSFHFPDSNKPLMVVPTHVPCVQNHYMLLGLKGE